MKKFIILVLSVLLLAGCAETYDGPTEGVLRLTEYYVSSRYYFSEETSEKRTTYAYDVHGNRVQETHYDEGELTGIRKLRYDDRGNEISETVWDYSGWIPYIDRRVKQTYDDRDRVLTYTNYDMWGRKTGESTYTYDDEANTTRWENGDGDWVIYYYDEDGRHLRSVTRDGYETVYSYDERGNRIGWVDTKDGVLFGAYEAGFDEQNRQIWGKRYDENRQMISQTAYSYEDGEQTVTIGKTDGGKRVEYYAEDGRLELVEDYDSRGELTMIQHYIYREIRVPADGEE